LCGAGVHVPASKLSLFFSKSTRRPSTRESWHAGANPRRGASICEVAKHEIFAIIIEFLRVPRMLRRGARFAPARNVSQAKLLSNGKQTANTEARLTLQSAAHPPGNLANL
jgi:hypothetical protein